MLSFYKFKGNSSHDLERHNFETITNTFTLGNQQLDPFRLLWIRPHIVPVGGQAPLRCPPCEGIF
jgi:hypothetical protein